MTAMMPTDVTDNPVEVDLQAFDKLVKTEYFNGRVGFRLNAMQGHWRIVHRAFRDVARKCVNLSAMAMYPAPGHRWHNRPKGFLHAPIESVRVVILTCVEEGNSIVIYAVDHPLWADTRHMEVNVSEVAGQPSITRQLLLPPRQPQLQMEPVRALKGTIFTAPHGGQVRYDLGPEYLEVRIENSVIVRIPTGVRTTRIKAEGTSVERDEAVLRVNADTLCAVVCTGEDGQPKYGQLPSNTYCTDEEGSLKAAMVAWRSMCNSVTDGCVQLPDSWAPQPVFCCTWRQLMHGLLQFHPTTPIKQALLEGMSVGGNVHITSPLSKVSRLEEIQPSAEALKLRFNTGEVSLPASAVLLESTQVGTWFHPGVPLADYLPRNRDYYRESDLAALDSRTLDAAYMSLFRSRTSPTNEVVMPLTWLESFPADFTDNGDGWSRISVEMDSRYVGTDPMFPSIFSGPAWQRREQPFSVNGVMYDSSISS